MMSRVLYIFESDVLRLVYTLICSAYCDDVIISVVEYFQFKNNVNCIC